MTVGTITILLWQSISERDVTTTIKKTTGNDRNQSFQFHWRAKQKMRGIFWYFDSIHFNFHYFPLALKCGGHSFNQIFFSAPLSESKKVRKLPKSFCWYFFFVVATFLFLLLFANDIQTGVINATIIITDSKKKEHQLLKNYAQFI